MLDDSGLCCNQIWQQYSIVALEFEIQMMPTWISIRGEINIENGCWIHDKDRGSYKYLTIVPNHRGDDIAASSPWILRWNLLHNLHCAGLGHATDVQLIEIDTAWSVFSIPDELVCAG